MSSNQFTLEDFRSQIRMVKKMGPLSGLVSMLPGMGQIKDADLDSNALVRVTAILDSMTPRERRQPQILNTSRKKRIARGAGRNVPEINRLLKQFAKMKKMMKQVKNMKKGRKGMPNLPFFGK
jgi:signal recognition particle subunit SRP54